MYMYIICGHQYHGHTLILTIGKMQSILSVEQTCTALQ